MRRFAHALALVAALALVTTACGGKDTGLPSTNPTGGSSPSDHVKVIDSAFDPKVFQVLPNTEVRWVQTGALPHSVTADDGSFSSHPACAATDTSQCMKTGDEFKHLFTTPGTYPYHCVIHGSKGGGGMSGVIIVK